MVTELRVLQKTDEVWVGGHRPAPAFVMEEGPYRPEMALWLDVTNDWVVGTHLEAPREACIDLADAFVRAMYHPAAGSPRQPALIRLADAGTARRLHARFGDSMAIEVAPTPELDVLMNTMAASLPDTGAAQSYLGDGAIEKESMRRFFLAAAALWETAPWRFLCDAQLLQLDCPALNIAGKAVSVLGNLGESYGVLIFEGIAGYRATAEQGQRLDRDSSHRMAPGAPLFTVNFERGADLCKRMRAEVSQHAWHVPDANAYPVVMRLEPDGTCRPLTDADVQLATLYAEGLTHFFTQHLDALRDGAFTGAREGLDLVHGDQVVRVTVMAPHAEWSWDTEAAEMDDEHPELAQAEAMRAAFLQAERQQAREAAWLETAGYVCETLFEFKLYCADGTLRGGWTAAMLRAYLLDHVPQYVAISRHDAACLPDVLRAFWAWAQKAGHLTTQSCNALQRCLVRHEKHYLQRVSDPGQFGQVKAILQTAEAVGIDPKDQDAMDVYLAKMESTLSASTSASMD